MNRVIQTKIGQGQTIQSKIFTQRIFTLLDHAKFGAMIRNCDDLKLCGYDQTKSERTAF